MAKQVFSNNASTTLSAGINDTDLTIPVASVANFPALSAGNWCLLTLEDSSGNIEIVKVTAIGASSFTVESGGRAQDGTSALSWLAGDMIELRITAAGLAAFLQDGDTLDGGTY